MKGFYIFLLAFALVVFPGYTTFRTIHFFSASIEVKTVKSGKSMIAKGNVYYKTSGGMLVTHLVYPSETVTITNTFGEYKFYDFKNNEVVMSNEQSLSSKGSIFYSILTGASQDLGLNEYGYKLKSSKMEGKLIVTTWAPPENLSHQVKYAEIVHQNDMPVFLGFYDHKDKPAQKTFYSKYQVMQGINFPTTITEIQYTQDKDSIVTKRVYGDLKLNELVDQTMLNFSIPANAKLVNQ